MDAKECYRVLELDMGASRDAVDAAYSRLIARWHPDRAAADGPEAVREAQRMVQAINDAYQTLARIDSAKPSAPPPTGAAPTAGAKPTLRPLPPGQPSSDRPPPRPPPPEVWTARSAPVAGTPAPLHPASPPASPPTKSDPPPAASAPPSTPMANPVPPAPKPPAAKPAAISDPRSKAAAFYGTLFPPGSPQRRFGPIILAAALVVVFLLGKSAVSSLGRKSPEAVKAAQAELEARTTGRLVVKSNRANTTIEATRIPAAGEAASTAVNGSEEGAAEQALPALTAGRYVLTARSAGWPDSRQDVSVEVGRTTEVAINFKSGSLRLDSDPTGATVRFGAVVLGQTPLVIPQLPPGACHLSLEYPSWPALACQAAITEGVETAETVRLPHGKLTVETSPPGATVRMEGRTLGQTPLTLERVPAGAKKLTLQAADFPPLEVSITVEDRGDVKLSQPMGAGFPELDPAALLRAVWVPDNPDKLSPQFDTAGRFQPQNGVVKNLNRKKLYEFWLRKNYRISGIIKSYDPANGQIEFAEQKNELSKYRVLAKLSPTARGDMDLPAQLAKGATFAVYGRLSAVEEPRWPAKVITFELTPAEPLR